MPVRSAITLPCHLFIQRPAMIAMVNHLPGHATVDANILACDESCLVGAEEQHHIGDVHRVANTSCRLLHCICAIVLLIISVYPSWRNGVDPCLVPKLTARAWVRAAIPPLAAV